MDNALREEIHRKVDALPEAQLKPVAEFLIHFGAPPFRGVTTDELMKFSGAWGEELGSEIAAIIERDCERIPEE